MGYGRFWQHSKLPSLKISLRLWCGAEFFLLDEVKSLANTIKMKVSFLFFAFLTNLVFVSLDTHAQSKQLKCVPLVKERVVEFDALTLVNLTLKSFDNKNYDSDFVGYDFVKIPDYKLTADVCSSKDANKICRDVSYYVKSYTGSVLAMGGLESYGNETTCKPGTGFSDDQIIKARERVFKYTALKFRYFVKNPEMQKHCCGDNQTCKEQWAATKLRLIIGAGTLNYKAHNLILPPHYIEISSARLANCWTTGCVDDLLLHELGHACHRWQKESYGQEPGVPKAKETAKDIEFYLGKDGTACVMNGLSSYYNGTSGSFRQKINRDRWLEEAFAEIVFAGEKSLEGVSWLCNSLEDDLHGHPKSFLGCLMYDPKFKNKFCK